MKCKNQSEVLKDRFVKFLALMIQKYGSEVVKARK